MRCPNYCLPCYATVTLQDGVITPGKQHLHPMDPLLEDKFSFRSELRNSAGHAPSHRTARQIYKHDLNIVSSIIVIKTLFIILQ